MTRVAAPSDRHGRTIQAENLDGTITYTVVDLERGHEFSVSFPESVPETRAYESINAMASVIPVLSDEESLVVESQRLEELEAQVSIQRQVIERIDERIQIRRQATETVLEVAAPLSARARGSRT